MILSKKTYRQVLKNLDHLRKQNEQDRKDCPSAIPIAWGSSIKAMIERTCRANHERVYKTLGDQVLEYLVGQGLLVRYLGDYTFPGHPLPSKDEVERKVLQHLKELYTPAIGDSGAESHSNDCEEGS